MQLKSITIFKRELKTYFQTPQIYVISGLFFLLVGYFFCEFIREFAKASADPNNAEQYGFQTMNINNDILTSIFGLINFLMIFIVPIFTMRLISEEKKSGTFELITTCPISDAGLIIGKFLGAFAALGIMIAISLIYPVILSTLTTIPGVLEWKIVFSCYLGLLLMTSAYIAFGIFASSLTENQIIASIVSYAGLLLLFLIGNITSINPNSIWVKLAETISIHLHSINFTKGVIRGIDLIYFIGFTASFLFLSATVLTSRRWRI